MVFPLSELEISDEVAGPRSELRYLQDEARALVLLAHNYLPKVFVDVEKLLVETGHSVYL